MQTIYYSTPNFIRHTGNVVDLNEYRRRLALAQGQAEEAEPAWEEPPVPARPRMTRRERRAWLADLCATLGILVMTVSFTIQIWNF